jgi:hypothetical protein
MNATYITRPADVAYEAVRMINHQTMADAIPAPVVYDALGALKLLGPALGQAFGQLGSGLGRSLGVYDVYEVDGADPAVRVAQVIVLLTQARAHADALGALLGRAQSAIAGQGYRDHPEGA